LQWTFKISTSNIFSLNSNALLSSTWQIARSSVSSVHDVLAGEDQSPLLELPLYYPEVNGTALLRERIAALYPSAGPANVLVTVGAAQANSMVCTTLLEPGAR